MIKEKLTKSIKRFWLTNRLLLIVVAILVIIASSVDFFFRSQPQVYTIGKLIDTEAPVRGDVVLVYTYNFNNQDIEGRQGRSNLKYQLGNKYFVSIPEGYPSQGLLMLDKPVPDSIKSAPEEGWKKLPVKFD